jgi:hypothetical protein
MKKYVNVSLVLSLVSIASFLAALKGHGHGGGFGFFSGG